MNNKVMIFIKAFHREINGENGASDSKGKYEKNDSVEIIETKNQGIYGFRNGRHIVSYEEKDEELGLSQKTILKIEKDRVELKRMGGNSSVMVFANGFTHTSNYQTAFGAIEVTVWTDELAVNDARQSNDFDEENNEWQKIEELLTVTIRYSVAMNGDKTSECEMHIRIVPAI